MQQTDNPLLSDTLLPRFDAIQPAHVEPAVDHLLAANRAEIARLLAEVKTPDWHNFVEPIEELDDRLNRAWSPVSHLNSVRNSDALRDAYNACLPKLSAYATEMGQNAALCEAYKQVAYKSDQLNQAQRKMLANIVLDFTLSGVDLPPEKKTRFSEISERLSLLTNTFEENLLDATQAWSKIITDVTELAGLPQSALDLARQNAEQRGVEGWLLTLDFPSYYPVMAYADNRALRFEIYEAYVTRASELGPQAGKWDNGAIMKEILALRHEMAQLLGFKNYAERSLAKKMASSTDEVLQFLLDLAKRAKPQAEREYAELTAFARERDGLEKLESWDTAYYAEKLRQARYSISQEELKPYFPDTRVIAGLFQVAERLFGIRFAERQGVTAWHPDVRFYDILDADGSLIAQFYFDLYAREKKRGGAWMDVCVTRFHGAHKAQHPVAYMTCNFTPPIGDKPALLTHDEVQTLFHEFGHGLHHMLTKIDYPPVSGISGVAWDAVELPSQFMENWCWEREALDVISGHYQTGAAIPEELYQRMLAAKHFQSAMQLLRQLEFSLFDFRLHLEYDPAQGARIEETLAAVREQVAVVHPPVWNRFANGFSHIFAGGYAAGYYSYKWAEVLSADAFSLFEEQGVFNADAGRAFREQILEKGGSDDAMALFVAFRGREPKIEPLLRHSGIAA